MQLLVEQIKTLQTKTLFYVFKSNSLRKVNHNAYSFLFFLMYHWQEGFSTTISGWSLLATVSTTLIR
jgi:hypothetical protein